MTAYEVVCLGLAAPYDSEFQDAMRPELQRRMLEFSNSDWEQLKQFWPSQPPQWQFNLCETLSPTRHGARAAEILVDMLLNGPTNWMLTIVEKLSASQLLDDRLREQISTRFEALPAAGLHETNYRQQVLARMTNQESGPAIAEASEFAYHNREALEKSQLAACYYCQSVFPASEVSEFVDGEETALCPRCGTDAVLPDNAGYSFSQSHLQALNEFWF